jgi:hypothetical protein
MYQKQIVTELVKRPINMACKKNTEHQGEKAIGIQCFHRVDGANPLVSNGKKIKKGVLA